MEIPIQRHVYIWANYSVSSYLNFIPICWNVLIWLKYDFIHIFMHHLSILLQYVRFCMSNNSWKSVLVIRICPQISIFALISVFAPEFNFRYLRSGLKVQGKMMHENMYKIVFQSLFVKYTKQCRSVQWR
jgi:hypothetical protein